ncbi:helix-turn-helix domain-containing protein [Nocardioides humi]|uniref:helix-turn-helix domain-containing protein n=1 Tax=Nocardioides humi TaxID=449461 RepID=UPI0011282917|nr:helix-turn-helix transcriptional regulator [Nocardioides humi]
MVHHDSPAGSRPDPAPALPDQFGLRARQPIGAGLSEIVRDVLSRQERVEEQHRVLWERLVGHLDQRGRDRRTSALSAVSANFVALAVLDDPADDVTAARLARQLGAERVSRLQHRASGLLDTAPELPWTTVVVRRLLAPALRGGAPEGDAEGLGAVALRCQDLGRGLLFQGIDAGPAILVAAAVPVERVDDLVALLDDGSVAEWRRHLATLVANPWGPYAESITELARHADRPAAVTAVEWCREWGHEREREQIAHQVQRLVALSGASQRQFAARIGTSPSRLSSYVHGTVTPSAALFLRIQRASRALQAELAPHRSSSRGRDGARKRRTPGPFGRGSSDTRC